MPNGADNLIGRGQVDFFEQPDGVKAVDYFNQPDGVSLAALYDLNGVNTGDTLRRYARGAAVVGGALFLGAGVVACTTSGEIPQIGQKSTSGLPAGVPTACPVAPDQSGALLIQNSPDCAPSTETVDQEKLIDQRFNELSRAFDGKPLSAWTSALYDQMYYETTDAGGNRSENQDNPIPLGVHQRGPSSPDQSFGVILGVVDNKVLLYASPVEVTVTINGQKEQVMILQENALNLHAFKSNPKDPNEYPVNLIEAWLNGTDSLDTAHPMTNDLTNPKPIDYGTTAYGDLVVQILNNKADIKGDVTYNNDATSPRFTAAILTGWGTDPTSPTYKAHEDFLHYTYTPGKYSSLGDIASSKYGLSKQLTTQELVANAEANLNSLPAFGSITFAAHTTT